MAVNLSDLAATPHIRYKTRLFFGDALFGVYNGGPYGEPMQWATFPGCTTPNSLFLAQHPAAHQSLMSHYLIAVLDNHWISVMRSDLLHDAALPTCWILVPEFSSRLPPSRRAASSAM